MRPRFCRLLIPLFFIFVSSGHMTETPAPRAPWIPDQGDGTYRNPVLFADYSDPDAIRVGEDYYLVSSSFSHVPGLPILHSRDLVNWTLINHALPRLDYAGVPENHFATPRHGGGVWAPALRFHDGKFWIFFPDPDFGIYVITATDPAGAWSTPVRVKAGRGLIDPCPFWDNDGQGYLVHGWAKSRSGINNQVTLHQLDASGTKVTDAGTVIIDANQLKGWSTLEGPKLHRRGDWYYIFAPAGGVKDGYQAVFRAKDLRGPWENRNVLDQGKTVINGPHQGAWVDTPTGENWFLHFQDRDEFGRVVHLEPMSWRQDGWPAVGTAVASGTEKGEPVLAYRKPALGNAAIAVPMTSDEFDTPKLGLQWQWQANPHPDFYSLQAHAGSLRLACLASVGAGLYDSPQLLLQKFPAPEFSATAALSLNSDTLGDEAGMIIFGYAYAWIGLRQGPAGVELVQVTHLEANGPGLARDVQVRPMKSNSVFLRATVSREGKVRFQFSEDGLSFTDFGEEFQATVGRWVGAKIGIFAAGTKSPARVSSGKTSAAPAILSGGRVADFDWFRVAPMIP